MVKVILDLEGSIDTGFRVALEVCDRETVNRRVKGSLSAAVPILDLYQDWSADYRSLGKQSRIEEVEDFQEISVIELRPKTIQVRQSFNQWLAASDFRAICTELRVQLDLARQLQQEVRILLRTDNSQLRQLPWQVWDLVDGYDNAEIVLTSDHYQTLDRADLDGKLKILVVLGNSDGIDVEADRKLFNELSDTPEVKILREPRRQEFSEALWQESWDILFFAGHSRTDGQTGYIDLNKDDSLPLSELRKGLKQAIRNGLQLAIFNSCDGLGLVQELETLDMPQMIVMREPVPDYVAQTFLRYFLQEFSGGKSLYGAVKTARGQLEGLQDQFPGATWLPVIYQHPTAEPPTWKTFHTQRNITVDPDVGLVQKPLPWKKGILTVLISSCVVTGGVTAMRSLGWLQNFELPAYDWMLRNRPGISKPDEVIRVITIDDEQLNKQTQKPGSSSLPDHILDPLLDKLVSKHPAVIASTISRNFSATPKLAKRIRDENSLGLAPPALIFLCDDETKAPPEIPQKEEALRDRVGFVDISRDNDGILRRHLMIRSKESSPKNCPVGFSFSTVVAFRYLDQTAKLSAWKAAKDIDVESILKVNFKDSPGAYQPLDSNLLGGQALLNYRSFNGEVQGPQVFTEISFQNFMKNPESVDLKDKIVLIGPKASGTGDRRSTPYGTSPEKEIPPVISQAHMISQIIDYVTGKRAFILPVEKPVEIIWMGSWAILGGLLAWRLLRPKVYWLGVALSVGMLTLSCQLMLNTGIWLPYFPALMTLLGSSGWVSTVSYRQQQQIGNRKQ